MPTIYANEEDQNVSYTVGYKETAAQTSPNFVVGKVTDVKVDSVKALNSKQIQVVYNQEMDKSSVENIDNYQIAADPEAATPQWNAFTSTDTSAKLQSDKKTVIITLGDNEEIVAGKSDGNLPNKTALGLQIAATNVKAASGKVLEKAAENTFQLNDTDAPEVQNVAIDENKNLLITFNEKIDPSVGQITVNGYTYPVNDPQMQINARDNSKGGSTVTISKQALTSNQGAALEDGKTYSIAVKGQKDVYGNEARSVFSSTFTYAATEEAPVLKSVTPVDEKSFILNFSEDLKKTDGTDLTVQVNKGAKQLATTATTASFDGREEGQYLVTLGSVDTDNDVLYDRAKNETTTDLTVYIPAVKDDAGNVTAAGSTSVTLNKDVTKPEVKQAVSDGSKLDVTLTEPSQFTAGLLAPNSYVLAENGRQFPVAPDTDPNVEETAGAFTWTAAATTHNKFTFTYNSSLAEGNYTLVIKRNTFADEALNNGNKNDEIRIPFAVGTGLQVKPEVTGVVANGTPGKVIVTFNNPVTYESVANYQNYKIGGNTIPSDSTFALDSTGKKLTITLPEATYKQTADLPITITGARNAAGTVMDEYQNVITVKENEPIKLQDAKVVNGDLILTFNENVNDNDATTRKFDKDFNVKVQGTSVDGYTVADFEDVNDATQLAKNQIKITAPSGISFGTGTVTVEAVTDSTPVKDAADNPLVVDGSVITATR